MIGLFAMSQAFETIEDIYSTDEIDASVTRLLPTKEDVKTILRVAPVTGLIGTMIGIIPGAGADIDPSLTTQPAECQNIRNCSVKEARRPLPRAETTVLPVVQ